MGLPLYSKSMALTEEYFDHILKLAHVSVSEQERERFRVQLENILNNTKTMSKFEIDALEPTLTLCEGPTPLREDVIEIQDDLFLEQNAPDWEDGCFRVPKIK